MRVFGNPVTFKGIQIYPVRLIDCMDFYNNIGCLLFEKNKIQDVQVIKMSYLDFLFNLIAYDNGHLYLKLNTILSLVLREQKFAFTYSESGIRLIIENAEINGFEFDQIRNIILEENAISFKTEFYDEELEKALEEASEYMAKKNGEPPTLEERIVAYHCLSGIDYEKIKNYTIYQFTKGLERFAIIKNFETFSALYAENGMGKDIQHWLCHIEEKGKYADVIMSKDEFDKITSDAGIFKKA